MKKVMYAILAGCMLVFLAGCPPQTYNIADMPKDRFDNVQRVFFHRQCEYSIMVLDSGTKEVKTLTFYCDVSIVADAEKGQPMWAEGWRDGRYYAGYKKVVIHIHAPQEVQGGGWDAGKGGKGMTNPIE